MTIRIPNTSENTFRLDAVRTRYVALAEPRTPANSPGAEPRYEVGVLLPKTDPRVQELSGMIFKLASDKWGEPNIRARWATFPMPLVDGDKPAQRTGKVDPNTAGHFLVNIRSKQTGWYLVDGSMQPIPAESFYPGCHVNVVGHLFTYEQGGVSAYLDGVQFVRNDTRLAVGGVDLATMFGAVQGAEAPNQGAPAAGTPAMPSQPETAASPGLTDIPGGPPMPSGTTVAAPGMPSAPAGGTGGAPPMPGFEG